MEYIVLGLLILRSMTIYELNTNFNKGLSLIYSASYGNLQYAIKKLLNQGLIYFEEKVENGRNKKIYHIKSQGTEQFYNWINTKITEKDLETVILSKIYFLGLIKENEQKINILKQMLNQAEEYVSTLKTIKDNNNSLELKPEFKNIAKYQLVTVDYGIGVSEFAVNWIKELIEDLTN